jgi:hypothetical protein
MFSLKSAPYDGIVLIYGGIHDLNDKNDLILYYN